MSFAHPMSEIPPFWSGGPNPSGYYSFPQRAQPGQEGKVRSLPKAHTQQPMTTGSSVFGVKYKDGVVLAGDTLGSYGSLARFPNIQRVIKVNEHTIVACSGDFADFQFVQEILEQKQIDEELAGSGETMKPAALHCWLTRFLYNKRSRFDPLWTTCLVAGMQEGKPFLGYVNYIGTAFTEEAIATGLGADIAVPIMRDTMEKKGGDLTLDEAKDLIRSCVRLCFYRDCRASPKYHMAVVNKEGAVVEEAKEIDSNWEHAKLVKGF